MAQDQPEVVALRHGQTEWSKSGQHTGRTDLDLTEGGEHQAEEAAGLLQGEGFDLVLSSPMKRARRTAELGGFTPYEVDDDLKEWDYGELEGLTSAQIQETIPGWNIWDGPWVGGETADEVAARVDRVVRRVRAGTARRVLLVAHGHVLRALAARWVDGEIRLGRSLALDTGTVSELGWEHGRPVLRRWNLAPGGRKQSAPS